MDRLRAGRRQLPTAAGGNAAARASELRLPIPLLLSRSLVGLPRTCCVSPARPLPLRATFSSSRSPSFVFLLPILPHMPRTIWANRTPNRRFLDATVIRRTPYGSKASRLLRRPAWSALALKRRQSDDKATP